MVYRIKKKIGSWNFSGKVPENFISHAKKSIPGYSEGHDLIVSLSDFFLEDGSICYDIGSSTGELLLKLSNYTNKKVKKFIGIEPEKSMLEIANKKRKKLDKKNNIKFTHNTIQKIKLGSSSMIISYYTIQFIPPRIRQVVINKIFKSLKWGGCFVMFEKIRGEDARFQDIYTSLYNDFKEKNKLSMIEIFNKQKSLRGILEPFSNYGNTGMLKRAGFKDISSFYQNISFKGYLAIK
jgi:tRNA (cmo5U34)-methyltransferase